MDDWQSLPMPRVAPHAENPLGLWHVEMDLIASGRTSARDQAQLERKRAEMAKLAEEAAKAKCCVNCSSVAGFDSPVCTRPEVVFKSVEWLATGVHTSTIVARGDPTLCGREGRFWQAKGTPAFSTPGVEGGG